MSRQFREKVETLTVTEGIQWEMTTRSTGRFGLGKVKMDRLIRVPGIVDCGSNRNQADLLE